VESFILREQWGAAPRTKGLVGAAQVGAGLARYLPVLGTDVSSGRTEVGMQRLKPLGPLAAIASQ